MTDRERLHELCVEMGVPTYRLTNADGGIDVGWLSRNMGISFFEKPGFEEASVLVKKIRREEFKGTLENPLDLKYYYDERYREEE